MKGHNNDGFELIWIYWYHKYIIKKTKKHSKNCPNISSETDKLNALKQKYHIQAIQSNSNITQIQLNNKLDQIKDKTLSSSNSFPSPKQQTSIYTINPQIQAKKIQQVLLQITKQSNFRQLRNQLISQLHSYYLNCRNIFIIYKKQKQDLVEPLKRFINEGSSLKTNRTHSNQKIGYINHFLNLDDNTSNLQRNQSILDSFDKLQNKIDGLEVFDKFVELDGLEIWNAKYLGIPHSFLKIKKYSWTKYLNRPLLHPSQPKTISDLPILPRLNKYKPSPQKLTCFVSFLKLLEQYAPESSPTIQSIFQYNNMPYIFVQDRIDRGGWQQNYGILCYYIAYGNEGNNLTENFIKRWLQKNPKNQVAKTIYQMNQRQKNRVKYVNRESVSLSLGLISIDSDNNGGIW